jgi:fucose permease
VLVATFRNEPIPSEGQVTHRIDGASDVSLSPVFYLYWLVIFFSVSVEWCMVFWGASFLEDVVGLNKAIASSTMFVFFLAVVAGRVGGSWLVRVVRSERLLILAIGLVLVGFPCFWLGEFALLNVVGLFIVGLGVANLFPLGLSAASSTGHAHSNKVSARISLAAGAAILVVPQGLGAAADQIGVQNAYAVVAVFSVLSAIMIVIAFRVATR